MGCCPPGWEFLPTPSASVQVAVQRRLPWCRCRSRSSRRGGLHRQTSASCDGANPSYCLADGSRRKMNLHNCARRPVARSPGSGLSSALRPIAVRVAGPSTQTHEIAMTRSLNSSARCPDGAGWVRPVTAGTAENAHRLAQRVPRLKPSSTSSTEEDRRIARGLRWRPAWVAQRCSLQVVLLDQTEQW